MAMNTWNTFRTEIRNMNKDEKEDYLKQLNADLMYAKTRRFQNPNSMNVRMLKKKIACLKTDLKLQYKLR